jgi:muramoyltetrapeptide carboxypeptidase
LEGTSIVIHETAALGMSETQNIIRPPALRIGDTVGIIAPAGPIERDALEAGCGALRAMGYKPVYLPSILERDMYFAGSLERRLDELHEMFRRDEVRGIICARGGYGCNYLLPGLDLELIRSHQKVLVGYSDVTTLLTYIHDATGLVTFHGPMVTKDFALAGGVDVESWQAAVGGASYNRVFDAKSATALVRGEAEGTLYGGCLSMLTASLGTRYEIRTAGTILFIEDVAARPYQVDRMLMQLKVAGKLDGVRGILLGDFRECDPDENSGYTLQDVIMRVVGGLGVPVAYGIRSGHVCGGNMTLPIGVQAIIKVGEEVTVEWEQAVCK